MAALVCVVASQPVQSGRGDKNRDLRYYFKVIIGIKDIANSYFMIIIKAQSSANLAAAMCGIAASGADR